MPRKKAELPPFPHIIHRQSQMRPTPQTAHLKGGRPLVTEYVPLCYDTPFDGPNGTKVPYEEPMTGRMELVSCPKCRAQYEGGKPINKRTY